MTVVQRLGPMEAGIGASSAVIWVDPEKAVVATVNRDGWYSTWAIDREGEPETSFFALVVHAVGDRERVMVVGSGPSRLALERVHRVDYSGGEPVGIAGRSTAPSGSQ